MTEEDKLWILGDVGKLDNTYIKAIKESPAKFYLVKGNHDILENSYYRVRAYFNEVYDKPIIFNDFFILSHEPMYVNINMPYVNIFGHVHENPMYKTFSARGACVCIERFDCNFVSLEDIKEGIYEERI